MSLRILWDVRIPLRSGMELGATVYLPQADVPRPCIFIITPYTADLFHERGMYFSGHGFAFVIVDERGRGSSQGTFEPLSHGAEDGFDVAEWLADQSFCNGKVSMWGGSYSGHSQWVTASEFPPHLTAIAPVAAPFPGLDFPLRSNIFHPFALRWLAFTAGRALQTNLFSDDGFWSGVFLQWHRSGRSFDSLDEWLGAGSASFQEWLRHPEPDDYWDARVPSNESYARLDIPVLTITGSYDDDQVGALEHYRRHMRAASSEARARHFLIIGPWDHAGTRTPQSTVGGIQLGAASLLDLAKLHLEWYGWVMDGKEKPAFLSKRVAYYVMGAEIWRHCDTLEQVTARHDVLHLSEPVGPNRYTYDPRDVSSAEVAAEATADGRSLTDQTVVDALGARKLVYETALFGLDTEVTGFFSLRAWIAIDCPDTDIYAAIYEITPDGSSIRLTMDAIRARYREGLRNPKLIETRDPLLYEFNGFTFISRRIARGNRLRLVISPVGRLIEATFQQKNYNAGGVVAAETVQAARPVTVTLFHDDHHVSSLSIPIGRALEPTEMEA